MTDDDELYAERLRNALHGEGSTMGTSDDGLARILQQSHAGGGSRRGPGWLAPLAVAAAAVVLLGGLAIGVGLTRGGDDKINTLPGTSQSHTPSTGPSPSTSTNTSVPSDSPTTSPVASSQVTTVGPPPVTQALPIYYVADVPGVGTRLYREFHQLTITSLPNSPVAAGKVTAGLQELFGGNAVDPDYTSLWPSGTRMLGLGLSGAGVTSSSGGDQHATVNLSDFPDVGAAAQALAIQQVVWTITGADPNVTQVSITVNGKAPKGDPALAKPVRRASALDVEANVWILAPTEGATVKSPVKVTVYGTGFEGNVLIKIFKAGAEVATTPVTTEQGGFAQASTTFRLAPGAYEVRTFNDNGKDGTLQLWDTKTFTVS